jgi:type IV pilus assembly protein PilP
MLACMLLLSACGDSDVQEVRQWMKEVDSQTTRVRQAAGRSRRRSCRSYASARKQPDPFSPNKLLTELARRRARRRRTAARHGPPQGIPRKLPARYDEDGRHPAKGRRRLCALLQIDRTVYQVRAGQHLGQNFGLITRVTQDAVNVKELVQDAAGEWVERMSKLELQDSKESTQ